jgi:hypothetical protein
MPVTVPIRLAVATDSFLPKNQLDAKYTANILKSSKQRKIRIGRGK